MCTLSFISLNATTGKYFDTSPPPPRSPPPLKPDPLNSNIQEGNDPPYNRDRDLERLDGLSTIAFLDATEVSTIAVAIAFWSAIVNVSRPGFSFFLRTIYKIMFPRSAAPLIPIYAFNADSPYIKYCNFFI